jgi:hypothetical protein
VVHRQAPLLLPALAWRLRSSLALLRPSLRPRRRRRQHHSSLAVAPVQLRPPRLLPRLSLSVPRSLQRPLTQLLQEQPRHFSSAGQRRQLHPPRPLGLSRRRVAAWTRAWMRLLLLLHQASGLRVASGPPHLASALPHHLVLLLPQRLVLQHRKASVPQLQPSGRLRRQLHLGLLQQAVVSVLLQPVGSVLLRRVASGHSQQPLRSGSNPRRQLPQRLVEELLLSGQRQRHQTLSDSRQPRQPVALGSSSSSRRRRRPVLEQPLLPSGRHLRHLLVLASAWVARRRSRPGGRDRGSSGDHPGSEPELLRHKGAAPAGVSYNADHM